MVRSLETATTFPDPSALHASFAVGGSSDVMGNGQAVEHARAWAMIALTMKFERRVVQSGDT
jgi:hypothetical protein